MSVLVRKRKLSELKFYDNAIKLRRSMTYLLMRDLGAKRGVSVLLMSQQSYMQEASTGNEAVSFAYA